MVTLNVQKVYVASTHLIELSQVNTFHIAFQTRRM